MLELLVAQGQPGRVEVRARLASALRRERRPGEGPAVPIAADRGQRPSLWLALAECALVDGKLDEGRAAAMKAIRLDRVPREAAVVLGCRIAESNPEAGYQAIDAVADAAVDAQDSRQQRRRCTSL